MTSPAIVGLKVSRTPNSLNWMLIELLFPPPWTIGMGNSPPARKLAEIEQFYFAVIRYKHVRRFQIAVNDEVLMGKRNGGADFTKQF
jgi:hypothetical protein